MLCKFRNTIIISAINFETISYNFIKPIHATRLPANCIKSTDFGGSMTGVCHRRGINIAITFKGRWFLFVTK